MGGAEPPAAACVAGADGVCGVAGAVAEGAEDPPDEGHAERRTFENILQRRSKRHFDGTPPLNLRAVRRARAAAAGPLSLVGGGERS